MKTKFISGPLDAELEALRTELKEQRESSRAQGNPYITGLSGRLSGIETVLSHPIYATAPEMYEALAKLTSAPEYELENCLAYAREILLKARGEL